MRQPAPAKRTECRTTGAKTLITATSLALTLSGWAVLTAQETEPPMEVTVAESIPASAPPALPPLPTLVPAPAWPNTHEVSVGDHAPPLPAAATPLRRVVSPPPVEAPAAPLVKAARPPKPVTITRSSR